MRRWLAAALAFLCASCGGDGDLSPVEGKVLVGGQPAKGAVVIFHPANDNSLTALRPSGVVGEDGAFTLSTSKGEGAPPGEYIVIITWREAPPAGKPVLRGTGQEAPAAPDRLKGRYADPKTSPLKVTVKKGPNVLEPFRLE